MSVEAPDAPVPPPTDAMEGVIETAPTTDPTPQAVETTPAPEAPPAPDVIASETLYIQNLNEKIKVDG